jgi:hypothetical protein
MTLAGRKSRQYNQIKENEMRIDKLKLHFNLIGRELLIILRALMGKLDSFIGGYLLS